MGIFGSYTYTTPPALWTSRDYFQSDFTRVSVPANAFEVKAMAFTEGQLLLVSREHPLNQVIYNVRQSPDDGRTWFPLFATSLVYPAAPALTSMVVWPGAPTRILLGSTDGLWVRDLPTIQHAYLPWVPSGAVAGW